MTIPKCFEYFWLPLPFPFAKVKQIMQYVENFCWWHMGSSPPWAQVTAVLLSGCWRLLRAGPVRAPVSSHASELKLDRHKDSSATSSGSLWTLVPCPTLLSIWLVPPWWTQVCLTLGSYWIQAFFSMIYLDSCWCTTSGRVEDWISAAVINFACTHNLFLPRSCFPNTLVCFAALSSFGGVESIVDSPEKQLFGWSPWDSSIVEFFLEGEIRLLKKESIHISSSSFQRTFCRRRSKRGLSWTISTIYTFLGVVH